MGILNTQSGKVSDAAGGIVVTAGMRGQLYTF